MSKRKGYVAPVAWGYRKEDGTFAKPRSGPAVGYGSRLGAGCYWRFGTEEDFVRKDCVWRYNPGPRASCGTDDEETIAEGMRWRRWRLLREFALLAPGVARTAFLKEAYRVDVRPREPGRVDPPGSYRYRAIGAADLDGFEIVIDLGFWVGPLAILNTACEVAAEAIIQRWPPHKSDLVRHQDKAPDSWLVRAVVSLPRAKAGFAWSIADVS